MSRTIKVSTRSTDAFKRAFVEAIKDYGIKELSPCSYWNNPKVLTQLSHLRHHINFLSSASGRDVVLVPSNGYLLLRESLPYSFTHEIVPFLWDCWPGSWGVLVETLVLLKVKLCFVTSGQVRTRLQSLLPDVNFSHVYEAVNPEKFCVGKKLTDRQTPIFEIGRNHPDYHNIAVSVFEDNPNYIKGYVQDYYQTLSDTQIAVSFPRCDTHQEMAGDIETLTERYWESMLSRCLMVGRAPQELIDIMGYDPVVEVDWHRPKEQLWELCQHLSDYQDFVDKNYQLAKERGTWNKRVPMIVKEINDFYSLEC